MTEPSVGCICLTADRHRFTDRAVDCFLRQTYGNRHLLIYDTGVEPYEANHYPGCVTTVYNPSSRGHKIGALRNEAIDMVKADAIVTWDSDDWSDPERVARQLAALQSRSATGYHNLLFLDTRESGVMGKAWEYDYQHYRATYRLNYCAGASLVYWRDTWKAAPFVENKTTGEDKEWCERVKVQAVNGVGTPGVDRPMLIAEYHGGNTSAYGDVEPHNKPIFDRHQTHVNPEWRRAPEWDSYCREGLYP